MGPRKTRVIVVEEIVATATTVVKKMIKKGIVAKTAAKKAKATKAKKAAPKAKKEKKAPKKKKKKKKKKAKTVKYVGGKRAKGQHKSKAHKAAGAKIAAAQKKKGIGLFVVKTLSADLAAICGKNKSTRGQVMKSVWAYIKKKNLNKGRMITADATLKKVFAGGNMFKLAGALSKHIK